MSGLFGSRSRTSNTQQSSTQVSNLNLQDISGFALANNTGNTITVTDQGALELARDVSERALDTAVDIGSDALLLGREGLREGADLAVQGLDNAIEATRGSLAFGESAIASNERTTDAALSFGRASLDSVSDIAGEGFSLAYGVTDSAIEGVGGVARDALATVADTAYDAVKAVGDAQGGVLDFAKGIFDEAIGAQQRLTDTNLAGLTALARQTSASADDRVSKVAIYALVALAAAMVLPRLYGKG